MRNRGRFEKDKLRWIYKTYDVPFALASEPKTARQSGEKSMHPPLLSFFLEKPSKFKPNRTPSAWAEGEGVEGCESPHERLLRLSGGHRSYFGGVHASMRAFRLCLRIIASDTRR